MCCCDFISAWSCAWWDLGLNGAGCYKRHIRPPRWFTGALVVVDAMDALLRHPRPPVHPAPNSRPVPLHSAGLAAMVYKTDLYVMAAESNMGTKGGRSGDKPNRSEGQQESSEDTGPLTARDPKDEAWRWDWIRKPDRETGNLEQNTKEPKFGSGTPDFLDADYDGERTNQQGIDINDDCTRFDVGNRMAEGTELLGKLHHQESGQLQGSMGSPRRLNAGLQKWQDRLSWVSSPVRRLLNPYTSWVMGECSEPERALPPRPPRMPKAFKDKWNVMKLQWRTMAKRLKRAKGTRKVRRSQEKVNDKVNEKNDMIEKFEESFFATTSRKSRESRRKTVRRILGEDCPGGTQHYKFGANSFSILAATLKNEKYKAIKPYLIEAKMMHLDAGGEWSLAWDRKFKLCMKAAGRDSGPVKKAKEVNKDAWAAERKTTESKRKDPDKEKISVTMARAAFAVATHWMLREVELSELRREDFEFDYKKKLVTLKLKKHKTDTEARGTVRVLQCTCSSDCGWKCPYTATWRLAVCGGETKSQLHCVDDDFILTTVKGQKVKKWEIVKVWKELYGDDVTGHSPRRTGALQYIREGWTIAQVAFLGRWRSQVIYDYAKEALETTPVNACGIFDKEMAPEKAKKYEPISNSMKEHQEEKTAWQKYRVGGCGSNLVLAQNLSQNGPIQGLAHCPS